MKLHKLNNIWTNKESPILPSELILEKLRKEERIKRREERGWKKEKREK
jgi:hypothetical protein